MVCWGSFPPFLPRLGSGGSHRGPLGFLGLLGFLLLFLALLLFGADVEKCEGKSGLNKLSMTKLITKDDHFVSF